jgi:hypothetical protein
VGRRRLELRRSVSARMPRSNSLAGDSMAGIVGDRRRDEAFGGCDTQACHERPSRHGWALAALRRSAGMGLG